MENTVLKPIASVIKNRRSVKLADMNGTQIENETVNNLLSLAHWAPTHGRTEPWHFFVYTGELERVWKILMDIFTGKTLPKISVTSATPINWCKW